MVCHGIFDSLVFTVISLCVLDEGHAPCLQMPVKADALWGCEILVPAVP